MVKRKDLHKKTIIYFTDSHDWGGAENYLVNLASSIDRTVYSPVVACPEGSEGKRFGHELSKKSIPVYHCTTSNEYPVLSFLRSLLFFFKHKPDLIHFNLSWPPFCRYPLLAAILLKKMIVITENLVPHNYIVDAYEKSYKRFIYSRIFQAVAVSAENKSTLINNFGLPEEKVSVIQYGIKVDQHQLSSPQNADNGISCCTNSKTVVTTIARLAEHKGLYFLIEAAKHLNKIENIFFLIVGDGPLQESLVKDVKKAGMEDRFQFLGFRSDIPFILSKTDIFVLPSLFEGLPISVLEAMAAGKPVIASDISGIPEEVIDGKTGILVPPRDPESLAEAIENLACNPEKREKMGEEGKKRVNEHFTLLRMVADTERLYEEATTASS